ncbi:MAG TPA: HAD-IC family P-type ATPase, partial [Xanthomonadales bacterium]|nr:HAD-IC family P-type ATPase [Xanthomonadales bacterium]
TVSALGRLLVSARSRPGNEPGLPAILVPAFVVGVLFLAGGTFVYWLQADAHMALPTALAVLVASCPCALSLALPAVHSAASFRLLKDGILLTRTSALHDLLNVDTILFDKTGTLTLGRPEIEAMELNPFRKDCVQATAIDRAVALEAHSTHPVARAFRQADIGQVAEEVDSQTPGGLRGHFSGVPWLIGNADYLQRFTDKPAPEGERAFIYLADQVDWYARFSLRDALRPGTAQTLAKLAAEGLNMRLLSGDGESVVEQVADRLNFSHWSAGLSAVDKLNEIQSLQAEGHAVLMVGDGANDAPVLSAADVSMTVQGATELANSTADFILTGESLEPVLAAFEVARKASGLVRQNLVWALIYNVSILPLAVSGYLQPWMAALGMSASSLLVVLNAARLSRPKQNRFEAKPP